MHEHALKVLEYPTLLEWLSSYAASESGKATILALRPTSQLKNAPINRPFLEACMRLRELDVPLVRVAFDDPEDCLKRVAPEGAILDTEELALISRLLLQERDLLSFLGKEICQRFDDLTIFRERLPDMLDLRQHLDKTFDEKGQIKDTASSKLREIRMKVRGLERRIQGRLDALLAHADVGEAFQEKFVAMRNGRYVVPVRRDLKSRIKGVVHDQSNSGQTLFMEPDITLEDGNQLTAMQLEERDEIRRIFAQLSKHVRGRIDDIRQLFTALTEWDVVRAISDWADEFHCVFPEASRIMDLQRARHPLLAREFFQKGQLQELIPLDLKLPAKARTLAITGSNTGGKTVALKTIGLLALCHQTGLPIPVQTGSRLPVFEAVVADIGDEQSIEQSLSTFSAHLKNISDILATATCKQSLVLMDEMGSGTDPLEGGALGCAILETLKEAGALTIITTHLGMIKSFVHHQDGMTNACVRFNADTLQPEYVLDVGRPGASHAFAIASRCGIDDEVLSRARAMMSDDQLDMESLLASLEEKERRVQDDLRTAKDARDKAISERDQLKDELSSLRKQRRELLHQAQIEAGAIVDNTRRQMDNLLTKAKQLGKGEKAKTLRHTVERKKDSLKQSAQQTAPKPPAKFKLDDLALELQVWVPVLNGHGIIRKLSSDKKRATIEVDGKSFDIRTNQLMPSKEGETAEKAKPDTTTFAESRKTRIHISKPQGHARTELNIIGLRVEQAIPQVERFLDQAALAGLQEVRVIHGFGTGRLRKGLYEYLDGSPLVMNYRQGLPERDPGGAGATYIQLS